MKARSAKNKGKRLQNAIRDLILEHFPQLEPDDVVSTLMGDSGADIKLSPAARKCFRILLSVRTKKKLIFGPHYNKQKKIIRKIPTQ